MFECPFCGADILVGNVDAALLETGKPVAWCHVCEREVSVVLEIKEV